MPRPLQVGVIGASGQLGVAAVKAILASPDFELGAAISRRFAGRKIQDFISGAESELTYAESLLAAIERAPFGIDAIVDVSDPEAAIGHASDAVAAGCHVIVGATLPELQRYLMLDDSARARNVGVLVAPNLSAGSALMQLLVRSGASLFSRASIEDRAGSHVTAPLRTSLELAHSIGRAGLIAPIASLRQDRFVSEIDLRLEAEGQELLISVRAASAVPYAEGVLSALRRLGTWSGLRVGLETVLFPSCSIDWN